MAKAFECVQRTTRPLVNIVKYEIISIQDSSRQGGWFTPGMHQGALRERIIAEANYGYISGTSAEGNEMVV